MTCFSVRFEHCLAIYLVSCVCPEEIETALGFASAIQGIPLFSWICALLRLRDPPACPEHAMPLELCFRSLARLDSTGVWIPYPCNTFYPLPCLPKRHLMTRGGVEAGLELS